MQKLQILLIATAVATSGIAGPIHADALRDAALEIFRPLPSTVPAMADNPASPEKIDLGKSLFFDPRLSASGVFSCYSCHNLTTGGDDNMETSVGHGWQKGPRNAPTALNAVLNEAQFWDGRAADLKAQAKGPVQAGVEMANTPENVVMTLNSMPAYVAAFKAAFPEDGDPVSFDNMARAIEVFEATLITPAPFDAWLNGDDAALSPDAQAGLQLFIDKSCSSCHSGVNVGGHGYYPFGLIEKTGSEILPPGDKGRFAVTETADDEYVFRAAPLRNIALTAPYFHSGKVWDLSIAVEIMAESQLGEALKPEETTQLVAFLDSLTGTLPAITLPVLPAETATTPRPTSEVQ